MGVFLAIMLVVWLLSKAVHNAKLDHTYAKQGMVSPRLEAKHGSKDAANAKVAKYGFFDHLRDNWRDSWSRRTDAMIAARDARAAGGGFRDRMRAAREVVDASPTTATTTAAADRPTVPNPRPQPAETNPPAAAPAPANPADAAPSIRFNDVPPPADQPATPDPVPDLGTDSTTTGGTPDMTTATGEVVNFETAIADLDARIGEVRGQVDAADAALASIAEAKANVETLQTSYEPTAAASATALDSKGALNLDGTTMGHAGTAVDAMPVGAVNNLYEAMEQVEQATEERRDQAVAALAALEAEREHLIATYADAHSTVAGNLGGDSRFLDSSGGNGGVTAGGPAGYPPTGPATPGEDHGAGPAPQSSDNTVSTAGSRQ